MTSHAVSGSQLSAVNKMVLSIRKKQLVCSKPNSDGAEHEN